MLKCQDISELAGALADAGADVPLGVRLQIRIHVFMCRHCRRFLRHYQDLRQGLAAHAGRNSEEPVSADFVDSVMHRLDNTGQSPPPPGSADNQPPEN